MISSGGFQHEGNGAPFLYECFMEVTSIMLFIGDVFGYITVDADGVVDSQRSFAPFVRNFVLGLELMHQWCMRHPPSGQTPKDRRWLKSGRFEKVLNSVTPINRLRMYKAKYPNIADDELIPDDLMISADFKIRMAFLRTAKTMFDIAEQGSHGECEPLRFTQDIHGVELYVSKQRIMNATAKKQLTRVGSSVYEEHEVISVCLSPTHSVDQLSQDGGSAKGDWHLYWNIEAYAPTETLYDEIKMMLVAEGIEV